MEASDATEDACLWAPEIYILNLSFISIVPLETTASN